MSSVDRSTVTIGDPIRYTLTIEADSKVRVLPPELGANLGAFEIRDYNRHQSRTRKGQRWTVEFVIAAYDTGKFTIPPVSVSYEANGKVGSVATQPVDIMVESVKPSQEADIKDVKPPAFVQLTAWDFRWLILSAVGLVLVLIGLWLLVRRRRRVPLEEAVPVEPYVAPHEQALAALDELERAGLLEAGQVKEFYSRLSEILRRYLERQFEIPALESTTREVVEQLPKADLDAGEAQGVEALLSLSDLVKFAKLIPAPSRGPEGIAGVRDLVVTCAARIAAREAAELERAGEEAAEVVAEPARGELLDATG